MATLGPIACGVDSTKWQLVSGAHVFKHENCSRTRLNHGVLVVGLTGTGGGPRRRVTTVEKSGEGASIGERRGGIEGGGGVGGIGGGIDGG